MKPGPAPAFAAVLVAVLLLLAAGLGWSWHSAGQAALLAADTLRAQQVLTALAELQAAVNDAESAPAAALASVNASQAQLRDLLSGNAEQFTRLVALGPLIAGHVDALSAANTAPARRGATALPGADNHTRLRQRFAGTLADLRRPAQAELDALRQRGASAARGAQAAAVGPGLLALLLLGAAGWRLLQDRSQLQAAGADASRAQQAQALADTALQQLMDAVPDAVCVLDAEGRMHRVNAGCEALCGVPAHGLVGRPWIDHVAAADQRKTEQAIKALLAGAAVLEWQSHSQRPDGSTVPVAWRGAWSAQRQTLVCVGRDLSAIETLRGELARTDRALQAARADLSLASGRAAAADKLNSGFIQTLAERLSPLPLAIGSAVDNLLQGLAGSLMREQQRSLATIREHAQVLQDLVRAGLEMASLEAGQLRLRNEAFDVWETANQVATEMRPRALDKGLKFDVQLAADLGYARGDAPRVAQVLRALLDNAIRFSDQGRVSLHADVPQAGRVRFQVIDDGIGIASADRAGLFEPFQRIDEHPTAQQTPKGTGLGLAVSRRLARLMGGDLVLDSSRPQHGSRFTFTLQADDLQRTDERPIA